MSMEGRFSTSTIEPKSPERARKIVIPAHQLSTASAQYLLQGRDERGVGGASRNMGLSGGHSSGGATSGGRKKIGSYAHESKKSSVL